MIVDGINDELFHLTESRSLNNKLIVEMYKKEALRASEKNGFAFVSQKLTLKGLKVLMNAKLSDGTFIRRGSIAYVKEEILHTAAWAQKPMECSAVAEPFLIIDVGYVDFVEPVRRSGEI
jgi:hypothetical protein